MTFGPCCSEDPGPKVLPTPDRSLNGAACYTKIADVATQGFGGRTSTSSARTDQSTSGAHIHGDLTGSLQRVRCPALRG